MPQNNFFKKHPRNVLVDSESPENANMLTKVTESPSVRVLSSGPLQKGSAVQSGTNETRLLHLRDHKI